LTSGTQRAVALEVTETIDVVVGEATLPNISSSDFNLLGRVLLGSSDESIILNLLDGVNQTTTIATLSWELMTALTSADQVHVGDLDVRKLLQVSICDGLLVEGDTDSVLDGGSDHGGIGTFTITGPNKLKILDLGDAFLAIEDCVLVLGPI
jgi:hypothetical protein